MPTWMNMVIMNEMRITWHGQLCAFACITPRYGFSDFRTWRDASSFFSSRTFISHGKKRQITSWAIKFNLYPFLIRSTRRYNGYANISPWNMLRPLRMTQCLQQATHNPVSSRPLKDLPDTLAAWKWLWPHVSDVVCKSYYNIYIYTINIWVKAHAWVKAHPQLFSYFIQSII